MQKSGSIKSDLIFSTVNPEVNSKQPVGRVALRL